MNPEQTARRADSLRAKLARVQKELDADGGFSADDILALFEAGKQIAALPFSANSINCEAVARAARAGVPPNLLREYAGIPSSPRSRRFPSTPSRRSNA